MAIFDAVFDHLRSLRKASWQAFSREGFQAQLRVMRRAHHCRLYSPPRQVLETITARIREYDAQIEQLAEESYPETALLKQVKGVGALIVMARDVAFRRQRRLYRGSHVAIDKPGSATTSLCAWLDYQKYEASI